MKNTKKERCEILSWQARVVISSIFFFFFFYGNYKYMLFGYVSSLAAYIIYSPSCHYCHHYGLCCNAACTSWILWLPHADSSQLLYHSLSTGTTYHYFQHIFFLHNDYIYASIIKLLFKFLFLFFGTISNPNYPVTYTLCFGTNLVQ